MASSIRIINPLDFLNWDEFVSATGKATFFHSLAWATVLVETYKYTPCYFTLIDDDNHLQAMIPLMEVKSWVTGRRLVSLPFSDSCEIISSQESDIPRLIDAIVENRQMVGCKYLEMRPGKKLTMEIPASASFLSHVLDLEQVDENQLFGMLRDSTRRNIKKALNAGVTCSVNHSNEAMRKFYALNCKTRKRHGIPPQPFAFFENIYRHVIAKGHGVVVLASQGDLVVAGAVCFNFGSKAIYKYGASDFLHQHLRANYLVMQEAIRWYLLRGYKVFDMGRTDHSHRGLNQFKTGWNTSVDEMVYYRYNMKQGAFVPRAASSQQRSMPDALLNYLPESVLKIIGTVAYRHVA